MSEEEEAKKEQQKQEEQDAVKKALRTGAKVAANTYAGPAGGRAVDLASNTKLGDTALNTGAKALNQNPNIGKMANAANKTGALDAIDKGSDLSTGDGDSLTPAGKGLEGLSNIPANGSDTDSTAGQGQSNSFSNLGLNNEDTKNNSQYEQESVNEDDQNYLPKMSKNIKFALAGCLSPVLVITFLLLATIAIIFGPIVAVINFIQDLWDKIVDVIIFWEDDPEELEEKYYQELKDTQEEFNRKYNICIDVNLITATLTVNRTFDEVLEEGTEDIEDAEDVEDAQGEVVSQNYKLMKKQVRLLAKMQIMTNKYGLDKTHENQTGSYCMNSSQTVPVNSDNISSFKGGNAKDSSTFELIASNDKKDWTNIFSSKVNEQTNESYNLYYPPFDADGNCTDDYANSMLPSTQEEISIGNYEDNRNSVYYWNLVNEFIDNYYDEYLSDDSEIRHQEILDIAEDIYLLYDQIGPNMNCPSSSVAYNCGNLDTVNTSLTKEEFVAGINSYNINNESWYLIKDNAEQIYDVSIDNQLNPEIVVTRAILEGFSPGNSCGSTNFNIWGWGATNGQECENAKVWTTWDEALLGFITGFKKSFPTSESYFSRYAYLGDYWYNPGNPGLGGCYYAPYIYPDGLPEYVANACDTSKSNTCTLNNTADCVKTTDQDKLLYGKYQSKNTNDLRKKIWNLSSDTCGSYGIQEGSCVIFKQGDSRWKDEKLINGTTTLGKAGCAVTSVSIAMTCSGTLKDPDNFNPSMLNQKLRNNQRSAYGALIVWDNPGISSLTNGFHYVDKIRDFSGSVEDKANKLLELLQPRHAVIIHTSSELISPTAGSHYVVLSSIDGTNARILDPATGKVGNWSVADIDQIVIYGW